ncbi:MAG: hypothetical protein K9N07_02270 [Candidatus Cloacimonetes bacterium]|nr:hypothetical protein [Candidatus Cloacimonadota bacterium]
MKRKLPLMITFIVGVILIFSEFIPHKPFGQLSGELEIWFLIISGFAILLGQLSLFKVNIFKIRYKQHDWPFYVITLVSFVIMVTFGFLWGTGNSGGFLGQGEAISSAMGYKPFDYLFHNVYQHLQATMFSLLAFFIASAAYRAFIGRTVESNLLLFAALLVMLGNTTLGVLLTSWLPESLNFLHLPKISEFIMTFPTTAGQRAIMIGAGLGIIGSSLRIILGIERSYLGGD